MNTFNIETHRDIQVEMNDDQLISIIEQRFASVFQNFRIHNGVFQKYYRKFDSVMFRWHDHDDEADAFAYKDYCDTMTSLKKLMRENR